ncbi:MAG: plasma-membrane proton-efflux P-type ATPase [Puia sp.]|nr:plasma-membrane proton-efflux P-type ATPase [Puia sp.]
MTNAINPYEVRSVSDILSEFRVQVASGLPLSEIPLRQKTYGLNEVPEDSPSLLWVFAKHFWGLTAFMLEFTILVSLFLHKYMDVYLIGGLMLFNAVIGFIQERKAAKTVRALKGSLRVMARVLREGKWKEISGDQLVPGDIIRIRTGDFITADAKLVTGEATADQSALTGESERIDKKEGNILYAGSSVKSGECTAVVISTGSKTFFGKTAELVQKAKPRLHMDQVVTSVVKILFSIVGVFLALTITVSLIRGETFLSGLPLMLILLISAVPVALPAMFSVSMAMGARKLAARGVLISRLNATEDAATLTTLCIDKTGTLTQNKLSVQETVAADGFTVTTVLQYAALASVAADKDPIDMAFLEKLEEEHIDLSSFRQVSFTPFTAALKRTEALLSQDGKSFSVSKGAYNTIKELCPTPQTGFDQKVEEWGAKGFKTMAVAVTRDNMTRWVGIAALTDPPLADSAGMITQIRALGVTVKMLTGDALPIAREIAVKVGIGANIAPANLFRDETAVDKKWQVILSHDGFAEVLPEDKFDIVKTLQQHQEITGMTGDGVNDAPALKQAEVGIAVKASTDVAKQAASVILLQDGLESIILLISSGRAIHHRITNWVTSKIAKTLFTVVFVCTSYLLTGRFIVDAFDMILLLLIVDFVALTLSTDNVAGSKKPGSWGIRPLVKLGFILGLLNCAEAFGWFFIGRRCFPLAGIDEMHSFGFAILFFTGIINILVVRTPLRFYRQPIGKILLFAIIADAVFAIAILTLGIPGFAALPPLVTASTLLYFTLCGFLVNDWMKTKFAQVGSSAIPH